MKRWFGPFAVVVLLLAGAWPVAAQTFEDGLAAARAGDFKAALNAWVPLANDGHAEAQFNVAAIYESGLGVRANSEEAVRWYALAADQGYARAQYNLAIMYADGRGVPRDDARAATWLRKAADQGHAKAQYNLAVFYQAGRGLEKNFTMAEIWFKRAAENGVAAERQAPGGATSTPPSQVSPQRPDIGVEQRKRRSD